MGIVVYFVKEVDLMLVVVAVLIMAVYDFWGANRKNGKKENNEGE